MRKQIKPTPLNADDQKVRTAFIGMRQELGLSRMEMATEIGMSERAVQFYESGERVIPQHVRRMMDLLKRNHEMKKLVEVSV